MKDLLLTILLTFGLTTSLVLPVDADEDREIFTERSAELGVDFRHENGMTGQLYYVEITGAGAALFDSDNDGDLDLYLVQGQRLGGPADPKLRDRFYKNELVETGRLKFTDVTERSGLDARGYGMGVATGDYDNDGDVDLYVTNYGANELWRNEGVKNGVAFFTDVTMTAGVGDSSWSLPAVFTDFDNDGWLDLYVGNYLEFRLHDNKVCPAATGERDYCGPLGFKPLTDRLFRGTTSGRFEDVTARSGLKDAANSMGVVTGDFDEDGGIDFYVANDAMPNQLWLNQGALKFIDDALLGGCAFNLDGKPEGSMGLAAGDVDGDGRDDLFVTHIVRESNTLYLNRGQAAFLDGTVKSGLGTASWLYTGFGTAFLDYDNDGDLDLLVANGAVQNTDFGLFEKESQDWIAPDLSPEWRLQQPNQLLRNDGGRFTDVTAEAGAAFRRAEVSRGLAIGDLDNDGDADAVVHNNHGPARVLINEVGQSKPWLGVRLVGAGSGDAPPRDMLGARAGVRQDGAWTWRQVRTEGSYASAHDPRLLFGLDVAEKQTVRVIWPGGLIEDFEKVEPESYSTLRQGDGKVVPPESP